MLTVDETYVAVKGADGLEKITEKRFHTLDAKAKEENTTPPEMVNIQTFRKLQAETLAEALELCGGNDKVATTYFNRGYGLRLETLITETITDSEFVAQDGIYDLRDEASKLPTRISRKKPASAEDLVNMLRNLPQDELSKILAAFTQVTA